jgi:hypothetical protein
MTAIRIVGLAVAVASAGCGLGLRHNIYFPPKCSDGLPVRVLIDQSCPPDGVCGYSCLPNRWSGVE